VALQKAAARIAAPSKLDGQKQYPFF